MIKLLKFGKYSASIHFSLEDQVYYGVIKDIADSVTFESESTHGLEKAFMEAIEDYEENLKNAVGTRNLSGHKKT